MCLSFIHLLFARFFFSLVSILLFWLENKCYYRKSGEKKTYSCATIFFCCCCDCVNIKSVLAPEWNILSSYCYNVIVFFSRLFFLSQNSRTDTLFDFDDEPKKKRTYELTNNVIKINLLRWMSPHLRNILFRW